MTGNTQEESSRSEVTLEIREDSVSNVLYEESADFANSVSSQAYLKAFQITQVILSVNSNYLNRNYSGDDYLKKDFRGSDWKKRTNAGTALRNKGQFFNIIAFLGDRGTGKTSAMLSYMEFLKDYYRKLHSGNADRELGKLCFVEKGQKMELMFTGLEYIDASLLGSRKDDVLRNVLPKMLKKLHDEEKRSNLTDGIVRDEDYAYKKRQIHRLFNNVYKSLRDLNIKEDILEADNDMFMETLENLSLTWNLRQAFEKLVKAYLDIMEYPGSEEKIGQHNHFLVISLDDLDMNLEHGFDLLEEIRKYLMVPNVIVLLSANYEQLEKLCIEHYTRAFKEIKDREGIKEYIANLSREYLEKILPAHCQVVMEPINQWKYYDKAKIRINYTRVDGREYEIGPGTLKEIFLQQLKNYFDLKLSFDGQCLRYLMPSTIRELALWIRQLYSLEELRFRLDDLRNIEKTGDDAIPVVESVAGYKSNMQFFRREKLIPLYEKYLSQNLSIIDQLEPEGQILAMKEKLWRNGRRPSSLLKILGKGVMKTREIQEKSVLNIIYLKIRLTDLFLDWYSKGDNAQGIKALHSIKQYFSNGIWGEWEREMMCQGVSQAISKTSDISRVEAKVLNKCLNHLMNGTFVNTVANKKRFVKDNKQMLINYQLLLMFFDFQADFSFAGLKLTDDQGNFRLTLREENYTISFALSNIMRPWEDKEKILGDFLNHFLKAIGTNQELDKYIAEQIDIRGKNNNCIIMPLENIEYLIYVGQMLEEHFRGSQIEMRQDLILMKIKEFFSIIGRSLEEYDREYGTSYKARFDATQIGMEIKNEESGSNLMDGSSLLYMLSESILRVAVPYMQRLQD